MSEGNQIPEGARCWPIFGPNSGGVYLLHYHEGRVYHLYGGDIAPPELSGVTEESVAAFLMRGSDPAGAGGTAAAQAEIRGLLDGWYYIGGYDRIRYERGEPVEIDMPVACADVGLGGHHCTRGCAPAAPNEYVGIIDEAERFAGCQLVIGEWQCVPDEGQGYVGRDCAPVRRARA